MSVFSEISRQYDTADRVFADAEAAAFARDDDIAFDEASKARRHNDQAYFLYLFTRFEDEVNRAVDAIVASNAAPTIPWPERRIWQAWSRTSIKDIALLSKVEVLVDKGRSDYAVIKEYYIGRNAIAHGGFWSVQFFVPQVAVTLDEITGRFATS